MGTICANQIKLHVKIFAPDEFSPFCGEMSLTPHRWGKCLEGTWHGSIFNVKEKKIIRYDKYKGWIISVSRELKVAVAK